MAAAALITIAKTIAGIVMPIAISLGADRIIDSIDRIKSFNNGTSTTQVINTIYDILGSVRNLNSAQYNQIMNSVNSIPLIAATGSLKDYINRYANTASSLASDISKYEQKINNVQDIARDFALQSDQYKRSSTGKTEFNQIKDQAKDLASDITKFYKDKVDTNNKSQP